MPIYLKFEGEPIPGEAGAKGYEKQIECESVQMGASNQLDRTSAGWSGGTVSISEITLSKMLDEASTKLFQACCAGKMHTKALISVVKQATDTKTANSPYLTYALEGVYVVGYSASSGGDRPSESFSLAFKKITIKYMTADDKGALTAKAPEVSWDLMKNLG